MQVSWRAGQAHTPYHFEVMTGVNNALAERHVPYVQPRHDWLAGPDGRKSDRVGFSWQAPGFPTFAHTLASSGFQRLRSLQDFLSSMQTA